MENNSKGNDECEDNKT